MHFFPEVDKADLPRHLVMPFMPNLMPRGSKDRLAVVMHGVPTLLPGAAELAHRRSDLVRRDGAIGDDHMNVVGHRDERREENSIIPVRIEEKGLHWWADRTRMQLMIPDLYEFVILALASYRTWRLVAEDELLDWPRRRVLRLGQWREEGDVVPSDYREKLGSFIACPACLGFWISIVWYLAWVVFPYQTLIAGVVAAISSLVIFQRQKLDPPE